MTPEFLLPFALASVAIEATPGPNMAYLAVLSMSEGRRAGFAAVAGVALGLFIIGIAAALGVAALISESPFLFHVLRWGGVAYLLWLAWDGWRDEKGTEHQDHNTLLSQAKFFRRGLITNLLNPKAALFYIAILPTFIDGEFPAGAQAITLTFIYVAIATIVHSLIVTLGGAARPFLESPARRQTVRRILAIVLALIAVWFAVSTR